MIFLYTILGSYILLLFYFSIGFLRTKIFNLTKEVKPVSIIVCARNEEKYIAHCLGSIFAQKYPLELIEIIFVDDASDDKTFHIAKNILNNSHIQFQIIQNGVKKGKKASLKEAIQLSHHELIITRDADTFTTSPNWLSSLVAFQIQKQSDFIIAPIALTNNNGLLWALQAIENNTLQVFSAGSNFFKQSFLCSGANLAFTKNIYNQCNGYESHLHILSGDDVLFLEEVKKIKGSKIDYLKTKRAIVYTFPNYSFKSLIEQKVRWAGKFKHNQNFINRLLAIVTAMVNAAWLFCFIDGFIHPSNNGATLVFILIKICIDFLILFVASSFIKNKNLIWYTLPVAFIYPIYACVVAVLSVFYKPQWK